MVRGIEELSPHDPVAIGAYRLDGRLGEGGMGRVYLAHSPGGRVVAVKVVRAELASDPAFRVRFRREIAAARRVSGLYTAPVVDADPDAQVPWMATAYVPGPSLGEAVADGGRLPVASVLALAAGLVDGLQAIHRAGLVHRDLKPGNVLLAEDGPRIIDFGIARGTEDATGLTETGTIVGTPAFMSPEQARGAGVTPASDIFNLGCVLAFAASGAEPFGGGSFSMTWDRVIAAEPNLSGVPEQVLPLVQWCLAKNPADRPTTEQLLERLSGGGNLISKKWLPDWVTATLGRYVRPAAGQRAAPAGPSSVSDIHTIFGATRQLPRDRDTADPVPTELSEPGTSRGDDKAATRPDVPAQSGPESPPIHLPPGLARGGTERRASAGPDQGTVVSSDRAQNSAAASLPVPVVSPVARRISAIRDDLGEGALRLAYHAAVPVAVDATLLNLLRVNFLLDPPDELPFDIEAELLLSPLFREIGDGLYEIDPDLRNLLLTGLHSRYGAERGRQVAGLLVRYTDATLAWRSLPELEWAQHLTAASFLNPDVVADWIDGNSVGGEFSLVEGLDREWFVAMRQLIGAQATASSTGQEISRIADRLASADMWTRVRAVQSLGVLARLPEADPDQVVARLCAFITAWHAASPPAPDRQVPRDVQAALTLIGSLPHGPFALEDMVLSGADLHGLDFGQARFSRVVLADLEATGINLTGAVFSDVILEDAIWNEANLTGAHLHFQRIRRVSMSRVLRDGATIIADATEDLTASDADGVAFEPLRRRRVNPGPAPAGPDADRSRRVFVLHGHNEPARVALFALLRAIGLLPLEWEQVVAETGVAAPSVGQVLDAALAMAQAVVVLLAPDVPSDAPRPGRSSARSNLLFELGMAMGRAPGRTVIVEVGDVAGATGLAGYDLVRLSDSAPSRGALADKLRAAGCKVDTAGEQWLRAGSFAPPELPPAGPLIDSASLGLTSIRSLIRETLSMSSSQVIGFGVTGQSPIFIRKLTAWLSTQQGPDTQVKSPLALNPLITTVGHALEEVRGYRPALSEVSILVPVVVDSAMPAAGLAEFWTAISQELAGARNRLILLFGLDGTEPSCPSEIVMLPPPEFQRADVARWTEGVIWQRGWPPDLATLWTTWLSAQAAVDGSPGSLDVARLYEAMDASIASFRTSLSAGEFREKLR